jgi:hypothetical protein
VKGKREVSEKEARKNNLIIFGLHRKMEKYMTHKR